MKLSQLGIEDHYFARILSSPRDAICMIRTLPFLRQFSSAGGTTNPTAGVEAVDTSALEEVRTQLLAEMQTLPGEWPIPLKQCLNRALKGGSESRARASELVEMLHTSHILRYRAELGLRCGFRPNF